ncbi:MAG: hypothetical protein WBP54_03915 [Pelodictyon phaeoclathratiforme]
MGTTEDYSTGRILENIRKALHVFDSTEGPLSDNVQAVRIQKKIQEFDPMILSFSEASVSIRKASIIALGERVCRSLHPGSVSTESVFLDELAEAMISSGQARLASIEDAEQTLKKHSSHPLIISMVSGRYQEICASSPPDCVYLRAEKRGLHCLLNRKNR